MTRNFGLDESGAAAAEIAMSLPILIGLIFGSVELSRYLWAQNDLQYAVEYASRCAAVDQIKCGTPSGTQSYAAGLTSQANISPNDFTVSTQSCGYSVSVNYTMTSIIPGLLPVSSSISASSCHP
jgi:Flp pilus assembly protein TadG